MSKKLLIVDDKREIRQLVKSTLDFDEWEIVEAATGDCAVETALRHKPDLIIMDMHMPGGIDGLEATKRILADPETAGCKVIMLSGSNTDLRGDAQEAGVIEFIQKPFSPLDLIGKIDALFGESA